MNWMKNEIKTAAVANSDPRIDSPEIKVVYPSQATKEAAIPPADVPGATVATTSAAQVLPQAPPVVGTTPPETVMTTDPIVPAAPAASWMDTLKQNATLFIIIALASFVIGIVTGKKMKS